jgi:hypothetical protein
VTCEKSLVLDSRGVSRFGRYRVERMVPRGGPDPSGGVSGNRVRFKSGEADMTGLTVLGALYQGVQKNRQGETTHWVYTSLETRSTLFIPVGSDVLAYLERHHRRWREQERFLRKER